MNISGIDLFILGIAFGVGSCVGHMIWHLLDRIIWGEREP